MSAKPPVDPGDVVLVDMTSGEAWVPASTVGDLQSQLDASQAENQGWRGLFRKVHSMLFGEKQPEEEFDSDFPGSIE